MVLTTITGLSICVFTCVVRLLIQTAKAQEDFDNAMETYQDQYAMYRDQIHKKSLRLRRLTAFASIGSVGLVALPSAHYGAAASGSHSSKEGSSSASGSSHRSPGWYWPSPP